MRMCLNILLNLLINNMDDKEMIALFISRDSLIEENCFKAIKLSLEIAIVPIRKFLIIFYLYLKLLLGDEPEKK